MFLLLSTVQAACISLATSRHCTEYKDYSIESFQGVSTAQQFDAYIDANSAFNFGTACPNWSTARQSRIRYAPSFACSYAVYYSTTQRLCNQNITAPQLLCKSSVTLAFQDVSEQLSRACPSTRMFTAYQEFQSLAQDQNCLLGIGTDVPKKCGLGGAEADAFCAANGTQLCCTATQNVIAATSSATALPSPSRASSPDSLGISSTSASTAPTTTTSSQPNSAQSSNSGGVNPLFIAAGAIGLILVLILAAALFFMTKRKKSAPVSSTPQQEKMEPMMEPVQDTMEVIFEYQSNLFDELSLGVGDEVQVTQKFDDGWALGTNLTTGKQGTFPMACLAPFGAGSEYRDSQYRDSQYRDSQYTVSTNKRASSLYADSTMNRY